MSKEEVHIVFSGKCAAEAKSIFVEWFLDGGGEEGLYESLKDDDINMVLDWDDVAFTVDVNNLDDEDEIHE